LLVAQDKPVPVPPPPRGNREQVRHWQVQNREAIEEYNALVAERGVFSDRRRRF
jgi:post-segregation antitoxin (ccd killing protein)